MKKKHPVILYMAFLSLLGTGTTLAQQHPSKDKEGEVNILFGEPTKSTEAFNIFIENAPKSFTAPGMPRFAIVGKEKKFYLGVGGYAKTTVSFDWGNPIRNATNFTTSAIPMSQPAGNGGLIQFSAATSNLFANFVALPGNKNQLGVYISGNFLGNDYGFELQFAYLTYRGFTVGYNYGLFSDVAAAPPTIDYENAPGFTIVPNAVVDYVYKIDSKWSVGIGAELPIASATTNEATYMVNQRIPDIPAYVQYSWGKGSSWLRFSAIMRNMQYRDVIADKNRNNTGWGIKMSGSAALCSKLTAFYQAAYGKGITSYFQDIYDGGLDMVPDASDNGRLETVKAWGGYVGLQYNFSKNVYASATYSQVRDYAPEYADGQVAWGNQYEYAQYVVTNVFWKLTPNLQMGVEYLWGKRADMDGTSRHNNRVQSMLQLNF